MAERVLTRAVESPLVRGGLTLGAGLLTGNIIGFARVALTAYLLGTQSRADSLAVALGPIDTLNSVLINSMVFGFVPMLAARQGVDRTALFLRLRRSFLKVFAGLAAVLAIAAPRLMTVLAPGLDAAHLPAAVNVLRILSLATLAAGMTAIHCALLYTDRRFAPTAFYQASLNICTIAGALALWNFLGVYGFAIGYTLGAWSQYGFVSMAARTSLVSGDLPECRLPWRELLSKPAFFMIYASAVALNITFTRAWATHAGPGMAAALDYCLRGVTVPLAILVNPAANSLLPEIARLRAADRVREAFALIRKTVGLAGLLAVTGCAFALVFREPVIRLLFERGSFTPESTALVSAVFLGLGPGIVGWSLLEIGSRSLFALDRPKAPLIAAAVPVVVNAAITLRLHAAAPESLGAGASAGLMAGFLALLLMSRAGRQSPRSTTSK